MPNQKWILHQRYGRWAVCIVKDGKVFDHTEVATLERALEILRKLASEPAPEPANA